MSTRTKQDPLAEIERLITESWRASPDSFAVGQMKRVRDEILRPYVERVEALKAAVKHFRKTVEDDGGCDWGLSEPGSLVGQADDRLDKALAALDSEEATT